MTIPQTTEASSHPDTPGVGRATGARALDQTQSNSVSVHTTVVGWVSLFVVFFALYAASASRGAQWQDAGFHIVRIMTGDLVNPRGLALSHPFHFWLGRGALALPGIEPAYAITLISSLAGAIAVANLFGIVFGLTRRVVSGFLVACALGLSHTCWQMATLAECNTITVALLSAELWCLCHYAQSRRARWLPVALFFNGLGMANHLQAVLTTPILAVVLLIGWRQRNVSRAHLLTGAALWLVGSLPYTGLVALTAWQTGEVAGSLHSALFGHKYAGAVLNLMPSGRQIVTVFASLLLSFPNLILPFAAYGVMRSDRVRVRRSVGWICLAALLIHAAFALRYDVVDVHTFFLPTYLLICVFAGLGYDVAMERFARAPRRALLTVSAALLVTAPILYVFAPSIARASGAMKGIVHHKPYRDDYVYLLTPWSVVERSAERIGREAAHLAGDRGVIIVEDPMADPAVRYAVLRAEADDVIVMNADGASSDLLRNAFADGYAIVLVPLDRNAPAVEPPSGEWQRAGDLYELRAPPRE